MSWQGRYRMRNGAIATILGCGWPGRAYIFGTIDPPHQWGHHIHWHADTGDVAGGLFYDHDLVELIREPSTYEIRPMHQHGSGSP